jgi:hypothetical protein
MAGLRVALFVEGSVLPPSPRAGDPRERIWNEHLGSALGAPRFDPIVPINKKHLLAMEPPSPSRPPMSGSSEGLDALIGRTLKSHSFDAAVVAWDLYPRWNATADYCRWKETLRLYQLLAESRSPSFPDSWKEQARRRHEELSRRPRPGARSGPPRLVPPPQAAGGSGGASDGPLPPPRPAALRVERGEAPLTPSAVDGNRAAPPHLDG